MSVTNNSHRSRITGDSSRGSSYSVFILTTGSTSREISAQNSRFLHFTFDNLACYDSPINLSHYNIITFPLCLPQLFCLLLAFFPTRHAMSSCAPVRRYNNTYKRVIPSLTPATSCYIKPSQWALASNAFLKVEFRVPLRRPAQHMMTPPHMLHLLLLASLLVLTLSLVSHCASLHFGLSLKVFIIS